MSKRHKSNTLETNENCFDGVIFLKVVGAYYFELKVEILLQTKKNI